jgi:hypothetical protein
MAVDVYLFTEASTAFGALLQDEHNDGCGDPGG